MPQPAEVDRLQASVLALYAEVDAWLADQQRQLADDPRLWRKQSRLRELRAATLSAMDQVDEANRAWLGDGFPRVYGLGASNAASTVGGSFSWAKPHVDAVTVLANDLFGDLLQATDGVRKSVKRLVATLARQQTIRAVAGGQTAVQAGGVLADLLEARGIWAVRYSDGSLHGIGEYSAMAVRTKSAVAYNVGTLNMGTGAGTDWYECFDGAGCGWSAHDDPLRANGRIVRASEAFDQPIAHANCRRAFGPRPDVTSEQEAAGATPSTTLEQQADQAGAEQARADALAARRAKAQTASGLARRQELLAKRQARVRS